jgi:predicted Zn-dependent peptidase
MRKLSFKTHPYRWSTIGRKLKHIADVPVEVVRDFYNRHYTPGNAVLSVVGNISFEQAKEWTQKWFASIPARECVKREIPIEARQERMRRRSVTRNVPGNALYMTFHMDSFTGSGYYPADVISDIFANGYSGRLNEILVKRKKLFTRIDAFITSNEHPGLFWIHSRLADGVTFERAEAAIRGELELLQQKLVPRSELDKVRNRFESEQVFNSLSGANFAANLALAEWYGDVSRAWRETEMYRAVTAEDVKRVAGELFREGNASVLYYKRK